MKNAGIMKRFSATKLRERKRSVSRTDMARLRKMAEAELEKSIRDDPGGAIPLSFG